MGIFSSWCAGTKSWRVCTSLKGFASAGASFRRASSAAFSGATWSSRSVITAIPSTPTKPVSSEATWNRRCTSATAWRSLWIRLVSYSIGSERT